MKNTKKKILSLLLTAVLVASLLPSVTLTAWAASTPASYIFDISEGNITVSQGSADGYITVTYGSTPTTTADIPYTQMLTIIGTSTSNRVMVGKAITKPVNITIEDVNIAPTTNGSAFIVGLRSTVNLTLTGANILTGYLNGAGLQVESVKPFSTADGTFSYTDAYYAGAATLNITANSTGSLAATGGSGASTNGGGAGIGARANIYTYSNDACGGSCGNVSIYGGTITAIGGKNSTGGSGGAGIGGAGGYYNGGDGGEVTISGGTVHATGSGTNNGGGAGIGGGGARNGDAGDANLTVIIGGIVTAISGIGGAGIGGGGTFSGTAYDYAGFAGDGGRVYITGGTVTATATYDANYGGGAGIGGGACCGSNTIKGGDRVFVSISGGTVNATGADAGNNFNYNGGAGIGGGGGSRSVSWNDYVAPDLQDQHVIISGGTVTATGGDGNTTANYWGGGGAGIGGGGWSFPGMVSISGGVVTATGGTGTYDGDGIGSSGGNTFPTQTSYGGSYSNSTVDSAYGSVSITGGTVTANSGGTTGNGFSSYYRQLLIEGGSVNADRTIPAVADKNGTALYLTTVTGLPDSTAVTYTVDSGDSVSCTTDDSGNLYLWLPAKSTSLEITANGTVYAATGAVLSGSSNSFAATTQYAITTASLPYGVIGTAYSQTLTAVGGTAPYTWSVDSLPSGLSLAPATGIISGTPTKAGTYTVKATVTDKSSTPVSVSKDLTLTVYATSSGSAPYITVANGVAFSVTLHNTDGKYAGINTVNSDGITGTITGTVSGSGSDTILTGTLTGVPTIWTEVTLTGGKVMIRSVSPSTTVTSPSFN